MSRADLLRLSIQLRAARRRGRSGPPWGGDQFGAADILLTEDGEPIITEDGRVASGDDVALEQEN